MKNNLIGTYDTATMLPAINGTTRPKTFLRERLFGGRLTAFETQYVIADFQKGKRALAPFVSRIIGGTLVEKLNMTTSRMEPPMVAPRGVFRGVEAFERMPGEVIGGANSPDERAIAAITAQMALHDDMDTRTEEFMCAQMLANGVMTIKGEGVDTQIDLGFTQTDTLSGASCWDGNSANIRKNIRDWKRIVIQSSGITPDTMLLGSDAADAFLSDETILAQLDKRNAQMGAIDIRDLPNGAQYLGYIEGVDVFGYDEWYIDPVTGVETPMIGADKAIICPSAARNPRAQMLYGAYYDVEDQTTYVGARIPRTWTDKGSNVRFLEVISFPLPFMPDVDAWLTADVLE
jgi:hypothetical protein